MMFTRTITTTVATIATKEGTRTVTVAGNLEGDKLYRAIAKTIGIKEFFITATELINERRGMTIETFIEHSEVITEDDEIEE